MLQDLKTNSSNIDKSIIKFIDIVLDLYSPVPYQIRNQMRILQNTLLYGQAKQLSQYMSTLSEKLVLKQKCRNYQTHNNLTAHSSNEIVHSFQKSMSKLDKFKNTSLLDSDSNKQNKYYLHNVNNRVNTDKDKDKDHQERSFCISKNTINCKPKQNERNNWELGKLRKISAYQYINREQDSETKQTQNNNKQGPELARTSSRTMLKIVKKSRSNKEQPLTDRSISRSTDYSKLTEQLRVNINQISSILMGTQADLRSIVQLQHIIGVM